MEKLYVYAFMCVAGFELYNCFKDELDNEFMKCPDNEELLFLESLQDKKDLLLKTINLFNINKIKIKEFGLILIQLMKKEYQSTELSVFSKMAYNLWNTFPNEISDIEPFCILNYADDPISYGDEETCKEYYRRFFNFYK